MEKDQEWLQFASEGNQFHLATVTQDNTEKCTQKTKFLVLEVFLCSTRSQGKTIASPPALSVVDSPPHLRGGTFFCPNMLCCLRLDSLLGFIHIIFVTFYIWRKHLCLRSTLNMRKVQLYVYLESIKHFQWKDFSGVADKRCKISSWYYKPSTMYDYWKKVRILFLHYTHQVSCDYLSASF